MALTSYASPGRSLKVSTSFSERGVRNYRDGFVWVDDNLPIVSRDFRCLFVAVMVWWRFATELFGVVHSSQLLFNWGPIDHEVSRAGF